MSDTNKHFEFDSGRTLKSWWKFDMVTKRQNRKDHSVSAFFLIYSVFSNRNQISLFSRKACNKEKKVGCPCSLVSCSHFSTDRAQYKGKSAMVLECVCTRAKWCHKLCAERMRNANVRNNLKCCWMLASNSVFTKIGLARCIYCFVLRFFVLVNLIFKDVLNLELNIPSNTNN